MYESQFTFVYLNLPLTDIIFFAAPCHAYRTAESMTSRFHPVSRSASGLAKSFLAHQS
jgi:hypothetical protein